MTALGLATGLKGKRIMQGFDNVGSYSARFLHEAGAKVSAIGEQNGGLYNTGGIDVSALWRHVG
jgi:glutamate dehydrogenase (NAD(P)+)